MSTRQRDRRVIPDQDRIRPDQINSRRVRATNQVARRLVEGRVIHTTERKDRVLVEGISAISGVAKV